ncbi:hypothetical protein EXW45_05645 [Bacillus wiedmannii]|uniref:toll/interleukin-1 receptor domain-containing protein n=1 Tax=Bacillus cereus group TaxID=86661 RepID=UPI0011EDA998|nr:MULTISPECIES: toll/interleukin-1 receptor domain-containing protein [Bacillus cereus group]KAA0787951.1 hypothetical protein DN394_17290 [Bacillus sp. BB081]QWH70887.1 hypothetical protein EXW45_05645 [Bacillus wiedmannii]
MFAGFNLITENQFQDYQQIGDKVFNDAKQNFIRELENHIDEEGNIDGESLQSMWFPQIKSDIFISHSHKDANIAKGLAGWLHEKFGLSVFIDSCVWGYSLELLKQIDEKYCLSEDKKMYDYNKRNYSTSHVHMMLSTALTMMMDEAECVIFLNTPNALSTKDIVHKTESPWIFYETVMTRLLRHKNLSEYRQSIIKKSTVFNEQQSLNVKYNVCLDHLRELHQSELAGWIGAFGNARGEHPLDILYKYKGLIK